MKTLCPIHRFSYNGNTCPFCEKERINSLVHKFIKAPKETIVEKGISEEDLQKLKEKFKKP